MKIGTMINNKWWVVLAAVVAIASSTIAVDARYAKEPVVSALQSDFEKYKADQELDRNQQRIWDTEDRLSVEGLTKKEKEALQERLKELNRTKEKLQDRMKSLENKKS